MLIRVDTLQLCLEQMFLSVLFTLGLLNFGGLAVQTNNCPLKSTVALWLGAEQKDYRTTGVMFSALSALHSDHSF